MTTWLITVESKQVRDSRVPFRGGPAELTRLKITDAVDNTVGSLVDFSEGRKEVQHMGWNDPALPHFVAICVGIVALWIFYRSSSTKGK